MQLQETEQHLKEAMCSAQAGGVATVGQVREAGYTHTHKQLDWEEDGVQSPGNTKEPVLT